MAEQLRREIKPCEALPGRAVSSRVVSSLLPGNHISPGRRGFDKHQVHGRCRNPGIPMARDQMRRAKGVDRVTGLEYARVTAFPHRAVESFD